MATRWWRWWTPRVALVEKRAVLRPALSSAVEGRLLSTIRAAYLCTLNPLQLNPLRIAV